MSAKEPETTCGEIFLQALGSWVLQLCIHQGFASETPGGHEVFLTLEEQHGLWTGDQGKLEALSSRAGLTGRLGRTLV